LTARMEPAIRLVARKRQASLYFADASVITTRKLMLRKSNPSKLGPVEVRFAERQYDAA
jgi:hypothetical protein